MNRFLISLLALLALIAVVNSITCYQDSNNSQSHSSSKRKVECLNCSYCLKVYGKVKGFGSGSGKASLWDCGCYGGTATPYNPGLMCLKSGKQSSTIDSTTIELDCCSTDKCNSAGTLTVFTAIATVIGMFYM